MRLPYSLRIILESALRRCDGKRVLPEEVGTIAGWALDRRDAQFPFIVARILAPDSSGAPLLVDLAAMRDVAAQRGRDPRPIEPLIPVDLVIDHSVQVNRFGSRDALTDNMDLEMQRNTERFAFLKWASKAFRSIRVVPPGVGILHQVNLEYLAKIVQERDGLLFPDTLTSADSHTPMINGIGVLGWGIGGIRVTSAMLGQPIYVRALEVLAVDLCGRLRPGVLATDAVLSITQFLRRASFADMPVFRPCPVQMFQDRSRQAFLSSPAQDMHAPPGLYVSAAGRARRQLKDVAQQFLRNLALQEGSNGFAR